MAKSRLKLEVLKYNALKLRSNYQLPYKLVYFINQLTSQSDKEWVQYLMQQSEHFLRVKGYYKKYPQIEREVDVIIENDYIAYLKNRA